MTGDHRIAAPLGRGVPPLPCGGTLVCHADPAEFTDDGALTQLRRCLGQGELQRLHRFRFERDRQIYLVAHALLRGLLARALLPRGPLTALRFEHGPNGRPEVIQAAGSPRLRFNLSHTFGLVACALCVDHDVGVDVEYLERHTAVDALARTVLSPAELDDLHSQQPEHQRRRFFEFWTFKEAYLKAVGAGLGLPLQRICFKVPGTPPASTAAVTFLPGVEDDPDRFLYRCWPIGKTHQLALAVAGSQDQPVLVHCVDRAALLALVA